METHGVASLLCWALFGLGLALAPPAKAQPVPSPGPITPYSQTTVSGDMVARLGPQGIAGLWGGYYRKVTDYDSKGGYERAYWQAGGAIGVNPAYGQASVHVEGLFGGFAQGRIQYDAYRFFGSWGALLSFPSKDSPFGQSEIDALSGKEQSAWGQRLLIQPTLRAKFGRIILRNQTDLAYYRFSGTGPYFYEWEYDTLLHSGDWLVDNRIQAMAVLYQSSPQSLLLAGPVYEYTHAKDSGITRQRLAGQFYWAFADRLGIWARPRLYGQAGENLKDRNRQGQFYIILGVGSDIDL